MARNGLIWQGDVDISLRTVASGSQSGVAPSGDPWVNDAHLEASAVTNQLFGTGLVYVGIDLVGGPVSGNTVTIDLLGHTTITSSCADDADLSAGVIYRDFTIYARPQFGDYYCTFSGIEVYVDGALHSTKPSGTYASNLLGPAFTPLNGLVRIYGRGSAVAASGATEPTSYTSTSTVNATISGGLQVDDGGGPEGLAMITLADWSAPGTGPLGLDASGIIVSTNTYGEHIKTYAKQHRARQGSGTCGVDEQTGPGQGEDHLDYGEVYLMPNLEREIHRVNGQDYYALLRRFQFPKTTVQRRRTWRNGDGSILLNVAETRPTVHAEKPSVAFAAGPVEHQYEAEIFGEKLYAPCIAQRQRVYSTIEEADVCFDIIFPANESVSESVTITFPYETGAISGFLQVNGTDHYQTTARYYNSWGNPHWEMSLQTAPWELNGSPKQWQDEWGPIRQQWLDLAGIDQASRRQTRNHVIGDAQWFENPWTPWQDAIAGGRRWIGHSRFDVRNPAPKTSHTFTSASSSLWTGTDCTITHGASMSVTSTGASTVKVTLDVGSFTVAPYQWMHLADEVTQDWTATNIDAVRAYAVGVEGTRQLIAEDTDLKGVLVAIPRGAATKYAGTWGLDNGYSITDVGADVTGDGISAATMADAERAASFQLLPGHGLASYELEIDITNTANPVTINYPVFGANPATPPYFVWEHGSAGTMLWGWDSGRKKGTAVRFGSHEYRDQLNWYNPPNVAPQWNKPSVVDGLAWINHWLLGVDYQTGISTVLATIYDSYEGQSVGGCDQDTMMFPVGLNDGSTKRQYWWMVSVPREIPPIALWPRRTRSTSTWAENGDYAQVVYSFIQEPSRYIAPGVKPMHLYDSGGTRWTQQESNWPTGWVVTSHRHAVTNSEAADFELKI